MQLKNKYSTEHSKKLPPYGQIINAYLQECIKLKRHITIYIGKGAKQDAYHDKINGGLCMYLPAGESVKDYFWPIYGQSIIVDHCGDLTPAIAKKICFYFIEFHQPKILWLQYDNSTYDINFYFVNPIHANDKKEFINV
jgi:hypothetical protein